MRSHEIKLKQIKPNKIKCNIMKTSETVKSNETGKIKWNQDQLVETEWNHLKYFETKLIQVKLSEIT